MSQAGQPRGPVVVVAEHCLEGLAPVTWEMISCARALAGHIGGEVLLIVLGRDAEPLASQASSRTGLAVTALIAEGLDRLHGEAVRLLLAPLLEQWQARAVLAAHTTGGLDWLPGLAVRLGAICVTAVEALSEEGGSLTLTRSALFGKALEDIAPLGLPLAFTVQPGAFPPAPAWEGAAPPLRALTLDLPFCRSRLLDYPPAPPQDRALAQARVVVAGGRGVGRPEHLELLRDLAACFSGAALAGSRPICDLGWLGYQSQVGLTGATVAPKLYIACGISGARQHTLGMQGSGFIVAINSDPQAAIFNLADVWVVEDLTVFLPALIERCRREHSA